MTEPVRDRPLVAPRPHAAELRADLEELGRIDQAGRFGRTAAQVGPPSAFVVIGTWAARLAGLDLDPGPGVDMPADVVAAWISAVALIAAWWMNRPRR